MLDLEKFDQSLKLTWIRRFFCTSSKWKQLTQSQFPELEQAINYSDKFIENIKNTTKNLFWKDVLTYLTSFVKKYKYFSKTEAKNSSFLYNSKIKIGRSEIKDRILKEKNIFLINQFMNEDRFQTYREFKHQYNIKINMLRFNSIVSSVKSYIKLIPPATISQKLEFPSPFNVIFKTKKELHLYIDV